MTRSQFLTWLLILVIALMMGWVIGFIITGVTHFD